ncbi:MAG: CorA family divalent cation transporter [Patescibacteria group bacterium]
MWITKGKTVWIDILNPNKADIDFLKKQHKFHPIILDELLHLSSRSGVEFYSTYFFLTCHLPIYDPELKTSRRGEIDFLITKDKVITVHYENLAPIESFMRSLNNNPHIKTRNLESAVKLTYYLLQEIINYSMRQLRHIKEDIQYVSKEIFKKREEVLLEKISYVKRDILDYSVISAPQEILLNSLMEVGVKFWGPDVRIYLSDLIGDHSKVTQHLENYRQVIESLEGTNGQLLNAKTNRVMQKFTIFAFLTFPIFLFFSLISVDFIGKFVIASPVRFWLILLVVVSLVISLVALFRKRKWL